MYFSSPCGMTRSRIEGDDLDRRNLTDPIHLGGVVEVTVDENVDAVLELATDAVGTSVCRGLHSGPH